MAGKGPSRRFSVSGLLVDGDLIDLDQPAESMLLKEDGFLMDSDLDTEIFKASPPKPSVEGEQLKQFRCLVQIKGAYGSRRAYFQGNLAPCMWCCWGETLRREGCNARDCPRFKPAMLLAKQWLR